MMSLANRVEHYLAVRRRFGSDLSTGKRELRQFAAFADTEDAAWITVDLFLRWKERFGSAGNATWSLRLGLVRGFAKWLHGIDPRTEIPPAGLIPAKMRRPRPYIYTDNEIVSIVTQAARLSSTRGLRGLNFSTLFGVLAVTGLRVSEAVGLDDRDVDLDNAVLEVRNGKVTTRANYRQRVRRELFEWPPEDCIPGSPWTGDSWRFGNRLRRTFGCGSIRRLSA